MQYFKNTELAKLYHVSETAVRKWIESAKAGKVDLQLHEHNGRMHIANTTKNIRIVENLVEKGKKYKNSRGYKVLTPKPEFYELYNEKQIFDIIANLELNHELPLQYSYFDGGARYWEDYSVRMLNESEDNLLNATIGLLHSNFGNVEHLIKDFERVNIIDLGVGDGTPARPLLEELSTRGVLGRYIAIDISKEMLDIAEKNIKSWFGDKIAFERYERDYSNEKFDDLIIGETLISEGNARTINLLLLFGGTLGNFKSPDEVLSFVRRSMVKDDLLIVSDKLDTLESRRYFDFSTDPDAVPRLAKNHRLILDLLNLDEAFYEVERGYDDASSMRFIRARLKYDVTVRFSLKRGERDVTFYKEDTLLIWRHWHRSPNNYIELLDQSGFSISQVSITKNKHYILTIAGVDHGGMSD